MVTPTFLKGVGKTSIIVGLILLGVGFVYGEVS